MPKVSSGISGQLDGVESHMGAMAEHKISSIDLVVVNLYPFEATVKKKGVTRAEAIERAVAWLERHIASRRLIVCCRAGMGRSVSVVIAYLCCVKGLSYVEAVALVKARRPGATPLPNLERTIKEVQQARLARDHKGQEQPKDHKATRNPATR